MDIMDTFYDGDLKDIWDSDLDPVSFLLSQKKLKYLYSSN